MAVRSKAWVCSRSITGILDSNLDEVMDVCCVFRVVSGLCDGLITCTEESCQIRVCVCELETSTMRRRGPELGRCATVGGVGGGGRR